MLYHINQDEAAEPKETWESERSLAPFLMILLGAGLTQLLKGWVLSDAKAFLLSWMIAIVVGYWLPPRPTEGFLRWLLKSSIVIVAIYMIFFLMTAWLEGRMPLLYYGIPLVTFVILPHRCEKEQFLFLLEASITKLCR